VNISVAAINALIRIVIELTPTLAANRRHEWSIDGTAHF